MRIIVTGGCGFIGSAVIRHLHANTVHEILNLDKLTYCASPQAVAVVADSPRYRFEHADITDQATVERIFTEYQPDAVLHLAAESHVDRSIDAPRAFLESNVVGTFVLLEATRGLLATREEGRRKAFRFHHVSTDEVFGDLGPEGYFTETTPYAPSSPYSASKAASDHLVRAWSRTFGIPALVTNCSNNYGPFQYPEKLIPTMILSALRGLPLPVYGDGKQVRDWLYVEDHAAALCQVLERGTPGQTYAVGGNSERRNIDIVERICAELDTMATVRPPGVESFSALITFVDDRPGHDRRYAIDASKIARELGWQPAVSFEEGLARTVRWYLDNGAWCEGMLDFDDLCVRRGLGGVS